MERYVKSRSKAHTHAEETGFPQTQIAIPRNYYGKTGKVNINCFK
jgi:hypothetical protein